MATLCPFAVWKPVPSHSGTLSSHLGLVVHVQVGTGSCFAEFDNPANQASSTWWIAKDGTLEQYVDADQVAWTEMAGNPYYDSVETEGTPDEPLTPAQCATLARLIAWGHQTFGWPLQLVDHGGTGITTHAHYPTGEADPAWGGHPCPGAVRSGQLPGILDAAKQLANPPAMVPADPETEDDMALKPFIAATTDTHRQYLIEGVGKVAYLGDATEGSALTGPLEGMPFDNKNFTQADIDNIAKGYTPGA